MLGIGKQLFFFSPLPRSRLGGLAFTVLTCFLLVGMVASTCGGIRGCLSVDCFDRWFLPDSSALGAGLSGFLGSFSWSYCLRHVQVVAATAAPPVLHTLRQPGFPPKTSASWVSTVASAPDSERAFAFGSFSLLGIQLGLVAFYPTG